MKLQNYEKINLEIKNKFLDSKVKNPSRLKNKLKLSWSNWGFGMEPLEDTAERLNKYGIRYIELHGNRYGKDLGYKSCEVKKYYQIIV